MNEPRAPARLLPGPCGAPETPRPYSDCYGIDRGTPIDRVFIDTFLRRHASLLRGRVLEVGHAAYARRLSHGDTVDVEVLDIDPGNSSATLIADLSQPGSLTRGRYDCALVTQTLQYVPDLGAAIDNLRDCLANRGALLVTAPGITRVDPGEGRAADRWRFTPQGLFDLLTEAFGAEQVACAGYGDLHTATAFLHGLAAEDIELPAGAARSGDFPVVVCGCASL